MATQAKSTTSTGELDTGYRRQLQPRRDGQVSLADFVKHGALGKF